MVSKGRKARRRAEAAAMQNAVAQTYQGQQIEQSQGAAVVDADGNDQEVETVDVEIGPQKPGICPTEQPATGSVAPPQFSEHPRNEDRVSARTRSAAARARKVAENDDALPRELVRRARSVRFRNYQGQPIEQRRGAAVPQKPGICPTEQPAKGSVAPPQFSEHPRNEDRVSARTRSAAARARKVPENDDALPRELVRRARSVRFRNYKGQSIEQRRGAAVVDVDGEDREVETAEVGPEKPEICPIERPAKGSVAPPQFSEHRRNENRVSARTRSAVARTREIERQSTAGPNWLHMRGPTDRELILDVDGQDQEVERVEIEPEKNEMCPIEQPAKGSVAPSQISEHLSAFCAGLLISAPTPSTVARARKVSEDEDALPRELVRRERSVRFLNYQGQPIGQRRGAAVVDVDGEDREVETAEVGPEKPEICPIERPAKVSVAPPQNSDHPRNENRVSARTRSAVAGAVKKGTQETKSQCCVCGEVEGEFIKCSRCPAEVHFSQQCLGFKNISFIIRGKWVCARCNVCANPDCLQFIDDAQNRACYRCGRAFHGSCAPPTPDRFDDWLCDVCVPAEAQLVSAVPQVERKTKSVRGKSKSKNRTSLMNPMTGQWNPALQVERDKIHNDMLDMFKNRNVLKSSSAKRPSTSEAATASSNGVPVVTTDQDWQLYMQAKTISEARNPCQPQPTSSGRERNQYITFGDGRTKCPYISPYPEEIRNASDIYVCTFCLCPFHIFMDYVNHAKLCKWRHPPGFEIYREITDTVSIFEVDGVDEIDYCRHLCLLSKIFLSSKTLHHEVENFMFYILCERTTRGFVLKGYFSKEKNPRRNNNMSCLLVLPFSRRSGYAKLLIDLGYQLSLREKKIGSPEHPLSDLGLLTCRSYWKAVIFAYIRKMTNNKEAVFNIKELSHSTGIHQSDLIQTLLANKLINWPKDSASLFLNPNPALYAPLSQIRRRTIKLDLLNWKCDDAEPGSKFTSYSAS